MLAPQCSNPHTYIACGLASLLLDSSLPAQEETQQLMPPADDTLPACSAPEDYAQDTSALSASRAAHAQSAMLLQTSCAAEDLQETHLQGEGSSLEPSAEQGTHGMVQHSAADAGAQLGAPAVETGLSADSGAAAGTSSPAAEGSARPDDVGSPDPDEHPAEHTSAAPALAHAPSNLSDSAQNVIEDEALPQAVESAVPPDAQAAAGTHAAAGSLEASSCPASVATAAAGGGDSVIDLTEVSSLVWPCLLSVSCCARRDKGCLYIT